MNLRKLPVILIFQCIFFSAVLFSQDYTAQDYPLELSSTEEKLIEGKKSQVIIKTSTKEAKVYLNGQFQGKTQLTLNGLQPGKYNLKITKNGFKNFAAIIEAKPSQSQTFFAELEKEEQPIQQEYQTELTD